MRRNLAILSLAALVFVVWLAAAPETAGYSQYHPSDTTATGDGCYQCHGWDDDANPVAGADQTSPFRNGGFDGMGPLHDLHEDQITGECDLCHFSPGDVPFTWQSGDPAGEGCRGCHGADPGSPSSGEPFNWGAGLREHHAAAGAPADKDGDFCATCHGDDPLPLPENTVPLYYTRADVNAKDPCNADGTEDWGSAGAPTTPDGLGLDNDGDLAYDAADLDCGVAQQLLTVNKLGTGFGTVTSNPAGIDCGPDCSQSYDLGTVVTLTAARDAGSTFDGWGGDCAGTFADTDVTLSADKTCTATFEGCVPVKDISGQIVSDQQSFEACTTLLAGTFQIQGPGGDVVFTAGQEIVLANDFEVGLGADFVAVIDPALLP